MNTGNQYLIKALDNYPYNLEEAVESLSYALSYEPNNPQALCLQGRIEADVYHNYEAAIEFYQEAMEEDLHAIYIYPFYLHALIWNNDYEKAKNSHHYFLSNKEWYNENKVHIEDYMNFVLAMNNRDFIKELLQDYPFLKTDYSTMYNAYLDYFIYNNTRYKDCYYPYQIKMDLTNKLYSEN